MTVSFGLGCQKKPSDTDTMVHCYRWEHGERDIEPWLTQSERDNICTSRHVPNVLPQNRRIHVFRVQRSSSSIGAPEEEDAQVRMRTAVPEAGGQTVGLALLRSVQSSRGNDEPEMKT